MKNTAVIGGGITGLVAAYRLQQSGVPVTLYEASERTGGVIRSERREGFLAEFGPNTLMETSPKISALISELGLDARKLYSDPAADKRYLVRDGGLIPLPGSVPGFIGTRLFSLGAKLRLLREPFLPRVPAGTEETVEQFVLRRLGREFLDYAIDPLVGGVYAGDPAKLSVPQAFPKLYAVEQKYGSLIRGQFLGARARKRSGEVSKQDAKKGSFDNGLQVLTDTLTTQLGDSVRSGTPVIQIRRNGAGWTIVSKRNGIEEQDDYSAVVYAGTAHKLAQLEIIGDRALSLAGMSQVYHSPVASVVLGFRREDVAHPLDGFGMLVPAVEKLNILGSIFSSSLFPNRAPAGYVTLTTYLGGRRNPALAHADAGAAFDVVLKDLKRLLGVRGEAVFRHHHRFTKAIPQYETGYARVKKLLEELEQQCPGLFFAGSYRDGISLSDSIVSGENAAERIGSRLDINTGKDEEILCH